MLDDFSNRNRAIRAAFELAAERGWDQVTFTEIAERTGLSLADLRRDFTCKTDLLKGVSGRGRCRGPGQDEARGRRAKAARPAVRPDHDALRGDGALQAGVGPHSCGAALPSGRRRRNCSARRSRRNIGCSPVPAPSSAVPEPGFASPDSPRSTPRCFTSGSTTTSPGLDRTMAALDRRLQLGEQRLAGMETMCGDLCRFACGFLPRGWKRRGERGRGAEQAPGGPSASPAGA